MRNAIVVLLGALSLVACARDKGAKHAATTTMTGGEAAREKAPVTGDQVKSALLEEHPGAAQTINGLVIRNDDGIITLRGKVDDEKMRSELVNRVRAMPNVRDVKDELEVKAKTGAAEKHEHYGTTPVTGATEKTEKGREAEHEGKAKTPATGAPEKRRHEKARETGHEEKGTMSKSDAVRKSMEKAVPKAEPIIRVLKITDDGHDVVTVTGIVPDHETHQALLKAAKETPGVKSVEDHLKVIEPKK